jgi:hypothetical protein
MNPLSGKVVAKMSGFDDLIDRLAIEVYQKHTLFICIHDLPYWIKRYLVNFKKLNGVYPNSITLDDHFENETEIRISDYFKSMYPDYTFFSLENDPEFVDEMNVELYELGEHLMEAR